METSISYTDRDCAYVSSDERRWINKIFSLKNQFPDSVDIIATPEENDGCIYARVPPEWVKLAPKRRVELTEEEKDVLRERLARMRTASSES